jgi:hypothetical protein
VLGARPQFPEYVRKRRLVMRDHRTATGGRLLAHQPEQQTTAQQAKSVLDSESRIAARLAPVEIGARRIVAAVDLAQPLHHRDKVGDRQDRENVAAAGIDHPSGMLALDDLGHRVQREIIPHATAPPSG